MTWITFLQVAVLIFEAGVVVMAVLNFWKNIKEEALNKKLAAIGKMLELAGKQIEESAKNKMSAKKNSESFEELLKRAANAAKQDSSQE